MSSSTPPTANRVMELPVRGMDCAECTQHVQHALCTLPGIESAEVFLSSEKALVRYDPTQVDMSTMRRAVEAAGYSIPLHVIELPVKGMDCAECTQHVQHALAAVPGVESVEVFLTSEKAVLRLAPVRVSMDTAQSGGVGWLSGGRHNHRSANTASFPRQFHPPGAHALWSRGGSSAPHCRRRRVVRSL
jgi:copper ion binding protein